MQNVVERVLNLLIFLLQSSRPVSADDVRHTVQGYSGSGDDAFHRMFERDKDVLRRLGVPLKMVATDVWEVEFGYQVDPEEYAIADPELTDQERTALSIAARMVRLEGSHPGLDALFKLGGVDGGGGFEPVGADLGKGIESLGPLFSAVIDRRRVTFDYRGAVRTVNPYGLAHRRGHWYLAGGTSEGERVYRVDRISSLKLGEEASSFSKPKGFDMRRLIDLQPWEAGSGESVEATVTFDAEIAWWAARTLGLGHHPAGEQLTTTVPVANTEAFIGWVLSFGDQAEVVSPPELRSALRDRVAGVVEALT
jgi:proteasome accessory factor B